MRWSPVKMKFKHNKKRNTAFLFETLVRELTKTIVDKNIEKKNSILFLIKEFFSKGKVLNKELALYKTLVPEQQLTSRVAERLLNEVKKEHEKFDLKQIFKEQSRLIKKMNSSFKKKVFANFVPHYKSLATINQIFNSDISLKKKVLLEEQILDTMSSSKEEKKDADQKPIDNLVLKTFTNKFNSVYSDSLLEEQQVLLNKYMTSFADNGLELKVYLNEELSRLKESLKKKISLKEIKNVTLRNKTNLVLEKIDSFKKRKVDLDLIKGVLKIQSLVSEFNKNGN
jgi:hypothetical protein